ncbi:MAG: thioredoxin [Lysobacterales bacterium]|nr:MAG: thioredoxin [Xanthomonadales bacterium]
MRMQALLIVVSALAAGAFGFWLGLPRPPSGALTPLELGEPVPAIALRDLSGQPRTLAEWQGKPLLLNFWASWCPPCIRELPLLAEFGRETSGMAVLAIALDDPEPVQALLAQLDLGPGLVPLLAEGDPSARLGNSRGLIPFTIVLDAEHRLRERHLGTVDRKQLEAWRERHAPSPEPP